MFVVGIVFHCYLHSATRGKPRQNQVEAESSSASTALLNLLLSYPAR